MELACVIRPIAIYEKYDRAAWSKESNNNSIFRITVVTDAIVATIAIAVAHTYEAEDHMDL